MEAALVLARFVQYAAASVLFGSTLLMLWARLELRGAKALLAAGGVGLAIAGAVGLVAQTALLAGSLTEALRLETLTLVMQTMAFGPAVAVRIVIGVAATLIVLALPRSRPTLIAVLACGAIACISFAWSGHAAATEGSLRAVHLAGDAVHALAAAGWVGSLIIFGGMVWRVPHSRSALQGFAQALAGFSGLGIGLVTLILLTGLANTLLIQGANWSGVLQSAYDQLLAAKLLGFGVMLVLAAIHRTLLVPALIRSAGSASPTGRAALAPLRVSLTAEGLAGIAILGIVSVIGLLDPFS